MRIKRRSSGEASIFTGSMADVSFLLIIFFMLTTVFSAFKGLSFQQDHTPTDQQVEVVPDEAIDVRVTSNGSLQVDGRPMALSGLLAYIKPKLTAKPDKPVILRTDPDATYSMMMVVFDELRSAPEKAGYEIPNIAIPTLAEVTIWDTASWLEGS